MSDIDHNRLVELIVRVDRLAEVVHQLVAKFRDQETELFIATKAAEQLTARNEVLELLVIERNPSDKDN